MPKLRISPDLSLPAETVAQTIVVYGGKGMGKTNFGSVLAEELHAARLRFSVVDPMGVWWGLQHGRRREEPGLEVLLLGGLHGDIPIEPTAGAVVADLVCDESISVVVDISRHASGKAWSQGEKVRFVTAYMTRLYERQVEHRRPLMQIIDEAARYAPQKMMSGDVDAAKCMGAVAIVCEEGRNIGIGLTLLTQRSARLNKDVAELADVMIAFRVVGPNSVAAVMDWFGEHVPKERHKALVEELRKLPRGKALVVSPGWLNFEGSVQIRERQTFDSSATPTAGQSLKAPGKASKPDLAKYRERMAETVEQAKANDPKALRQKVKDLERDLEKALKARPTEPDQAAIERAVAAAVAEVEQRYKGEVHRQATLITILDERMKQARELLVTNGEVVPVAMARASRNKTAPAAQTRPAARTAVPMSKRAENIPRIIPDGVSRPQQKLLDALAWFASVGLHAPKRSHVAGIAGVSPRSSGFEKNVSTLSSRGLISYPAAGAMALTDAGAAAARPPDTPADLDALHAAWLSSPALSGPQRVLLRILLGRAGESLSREELAGLASVSPLSSGFEKNVSTLSSLGLVEYPGPGRVQVNENLLFPAGLT